MATITQEISQLSNTLSSVPEAGHRGIDTRTDFVTKQETYQDHQRDILQPEYNASITELNSMKDELNTFATQTNAVRDEVNTFKSDTETAKNIAIASANYKGDWSAGYNGGLGYSLNDSISYTDGYNYVSKVDNNTTEPTTLTNTTEWNFIEAVNPNNYYLKEETYSKDRNL